MKLDPMGKIGEKETKELILYGSKKNKTLCSGLMPQYFHKKQINYLDNGIIRYTKRRNN
jgi:hypothetical protein